MLLTFRMMNACTDQGDVVYNEHEHAGDIRATINAITEAFSMTWLPHTEATTTTFEDDSHLQIHQVC
jgi:hypothetical protein